MTGTSAETGGDTSSLRSRTPVEPNRRGHPSGLRVVLDFDGTLVDPNVAIVLVTEFAPNGQAVAHEIDQLLHSGQIGLREAWQRQAALLPGDRVGEMARYVRERVPLRAGAREFLAFAAKHQVPVTIVSGGLDFYIREVLDREGLDLPVRSDRLEVLPNGSARVVHPYGHPTCQLCGICKAAIAIDLGPGERTVFIADGSTDRYAAETSDLVFARHRLLDYCRRVGIPCFPFEDFSPVTARFRSWLEQGEALPPPRALGLATSACPISNRLRAD
jgi:2-hydroxy-3-keto-5-methylthiopentenyl-1-phosphate phosphatase